MVEAWDFAKPGLVVQPIVIGKREIRPEGGDRF
jgi:hypothetical protein